MADENIRLSLDSRSDKAVVLLVSEADMTEEASFEGTVLVLSCRV